MPVVIPPKPKLPPPPPTSAPVLPKPAGQPLPSGSGPPAPPVPTSVDTDSLTTFASNVQALIAPVEAARTQIQGTSVQPGAFYHADVMRSAINGSGSGSGSSSPGLAAQYEKVLTDLANGLTDVHTAVTSLANKYTSTEELNSMSASDLQTTMSDAVGDFNSLITDDGGSPASPSPSSSSSPDNGSGSSNNNSGSST
jgi:hypothetical protein